MPKGKKEPKQKRSKKEAPDDVEVVLGPPESLDNEVQTILNNEPSDEGFGVPPRVEDFDSPSVLEKATDEQTEDETVSSMSDVELPIMVFDKAEFLPRLNITVRRGEKWYGTHGPVWVTDKSNYPLGQINVIDTMVLPFAELLNLEKTLAFHHAGIRNFYKLEQELQRVYPGDHRLGVEKFHRDEMVTIVFFTKGEGLDG